MRNWINLFETFDKLAPITWYDRSNDDLSLYHAEFQIEEGHFIVQFYRPYYDSTYTITFTRNNELKLSGTGSANVVLATVMKAIREFIEARDPQYIRIDMDKTEGSRNKLYPRLAAMMLREFPKYAMTPGETRRHHNLKIERPAKPVNWGDYKPAPAPQQDLPRAPRSMEELMADDALLAELLGEGREYPMADRDSDGWYSNGDYEQAGAKIVMMTPDEYLAKVRPLVLDDTSRDNIDDLKNHIEQGRRLDPLVIYGSGKEDGRHRAYAAKELGIAKVPVIVYSEDRDA